MMKLNPSFRYRRYIMTKTKTRAELISEINSEITIGGQLPCYLNENEINRIIDQAILFFHQSHKDATQRLSWMIKKEFFQTPAFAKSRKLILPDNIISVDGFKEVRNTTQMLYAPQDNSRAMASELYLSTVTSGYDLVMKAALGAYQNIADAQYLSEIRYNFNKNDKSLVVTGRTPINDVIISTWASVEDSTLFNDYWFVRFCTATAKQSVARMFSFMEFNLPGGIRISPAKYEQEANDELQRVMEKIKRLNPPCWMIIS